MDLKKKLRGIFSISAASAALIQNSASADSKTVEPKFGDSSADNPDSVQPAPEKLILEQADSREIIKLYAGHTSHASHSSHYSSSTDYGSSAPSTSPGYTTPTPNYDLTTTTRPTPPPTPVTPAPSITKTNDPTYPARLVAWKKQCADEGLPSYQYEVGMMYLTGNGLEKDEPQGRKYIEMAAAQKYEDAIKEKFVLDRQDSLKSSQTNSVATNEPVVLEKSPTTGVKSDGQSDDITKLISKAATGSSSAQYELGLRYVKGLGVEKNLEKGKSYLEMAAAQGDTNATSLLEDLKNPSP